MWLNSNKPVPSRSNQLSVCPQRVENARTETNEQGGATLKLPLKRTWLIRPPVGAVKKYELDEVGLLVWQQCDGQTTLEQIIKAVSSRYRINLREAEVSTLQFLQMLSRKGLIQGRS